MQCRLCNNSDLTLYYHQGNKQQFHYYKCSNCGLVNLDLSNLDIASSQDKYAGFEDPRHCINAGSNHTYQYLKKRFNKTGTYLDIGCGSGSLLYLMQKQGWKVTGLEIIPSLAETVNTELGFEVINANFMFYSTGERRFDLITLRHVLEHIPDSILALSKLNKLLSKGGHVLLEFPNIEGLSFWFRRLLAKYHISYRKYHPDYVPGHCNEFSIKPFQFLTEKTGFEIVDWHGYSNKPLMNALYKIIPVSTKTRTLIRKTIDI